MNIGLYAPLKPLGIGAPSGDAATAAGLQAFLQKRGHVVTQMSTLRARNAFDNKQILQQVPVERQKALGLARKMNIDIWLTFHSYWKSPDLLGPWCCDRLNVPYVIHKAMHAQKRRRDRKSLPGFLTNRKALRRADAVFTDDGNNMPALEALLGNNVNLLLPGIDSAHFYPDPEAATTLRHKYGVQNKKLIAAVTMLRPGVKTQSIRYLLESFAQLNACCDAHLLVAGDGSTREELKALARKLIPGRHTFVGRMDKNNLRALYSAADVFAFPGIGESLGMVYLEAMCCGTPVVACDGPGPSQLVLHEKTGLLVEPHNVRAFTRAVGHLLNGKELRTSLGRNARTHVLDHHVLDANLSILETAMVELVEQESSPSPEMK